ncbi:MAG: hypothetical protein ABR915_04570 [Thermoguttaceae bacterium]
MRKLWPALVIAALSAAGCCVAPPQIFHPGTEGQQQARAQRFDPYPENDVGPAIAGGRPQEYGSPRAEVLRVQPRLDGPLLAPCPLPGP